jgi:Zn-dependent metalloprotease
MYVVVAVLLIVTIMFGNALPSSKVQAFTEIDPLAGLRIGMHDQTGKATFIGADPNTPFKLQSASVDGLLPQDRSLHYLDYFSDMLGLSSPQKELLVTRQSALQSSRGDSVRYQQIYQGVPILGGELIVNTDSRGGLLSINGEISPDLSLSVKPTVTAQEAGEVALGVVSKAYGLDRNQLTVVEPELWIFDERLLKSSERPAELVWRMEVRAMNGGPINELVLINAQKGGVSLHFNQIETSWSGNNPLVPGIHNSISTAINKPRPAQNTHANTEGIRTLNGGNTWYVSMTGTDSNDCATTITECASINGALGKAGFVAGDTIKVASGTYTGAGSEVILVSQDVSLYGGWDVTFTTQDGTSIIDGENTRRGITLSGGRTATVDNFSIQHSSNSGIYIPSGATLTITNSTIRNGSSTHGGGIYNDSGTLNLVNSTISGNYAMFGGGIDNEGGVVSIYSSTISNNVGEPFGGGIRNADSGTATIQNTILAGNTGSDCREDEITITSLGFNLVGEVIAPWCFFTPTTGDLTNLDAKLGPLLGMPGHHPLEVVSPAINGGNPSGCKDNLGTPLITDQRSMPRVGVCDIGAFEYTVPGAPAAIVAAYGSSQRTQPGTEFNYPLQAAVIDSNGGLVETSELVTFTAPGSGPSGIFEDSGTASTTAYTDVTGIATSSILNGNTTPGSFSVSATVVGAATPAEFQLAIFGWYVSLTGTDSNDCESSSSTCATIGGVLAKGGFLPGDTVLIGSGTYTGSGNEVVNLDADIRLIGGWNSSFTSQTGFSTIDGENARRGITVQQVTDVTIERFIIENGSWDPGGGIFSSGNLTLVSCIVRDNTSGGGGGIYNNQAGSPINDRTLTIWNSSITNNTVTTGGGAIFNGWGEVLVYNSTLSGNFSDGPGAITNYGGELYLYNSTISNNTATNSYHTGGIRNESGGIVTLQNSILAGNIAEKSDCMGDITSSGYNLIGDTTGCVFTSSTGDLTNINPNLSALDDHGGLTETHGLYLTSPAIDAGNPATPGGGVGACEPTDQREISRPIDGDGVGGARCDIGAYELDPASPPAFPPGDRSTYDANNGTSIPGTFVCDETIPSCTLGSDTHADAAHQYTSDTYAFYMDHHGRDSIDDVGMRLVSTVHYDSAFANAYWNGSQMVYGDAYGYPLADDVVAHELTHGVTDYTSNLFYYYQSGAINESLSDLWGEFVDLTNGAGDDSPGVRWHVGEDILGLTGAIRDMENPPATGDPDKMTSSYYYTDSADMGYFGDNGGVHTNSGVNNKAVYLMTDGGSFNGKTVTGLGIDKVAALYYEVQTSLLTSGADYGDLYNAIYQACLNLVSGAEGITNSDCTEVREATAAVEMNLEPVLGYNPHAEYCPAGGMPVILFSDDFESGTANWSFSGGNWAISTGFATSGDFLLWGDDATLSSDTNASLNLDVYLPQGSQPYLIFNHAFGLEDPDYDGAWLEYSTNSGGFWGDAEGLFGDGLMYTGEINTLTGFGDNPHTGRTAFVGDSHGYVSTRYDLAPLAGSNVRFRWRISTDSEFHDLGWILDDVRIYICGENLLFLPLISR